jgi:hypothetical protein
MNRSKILVAIVFFLIFVSTLAGIAGHTNVKGYVEVSGPTYFAKDGYNYEYKYGFPTPSRSRYYKIPSHDLTAEIKATTKRSCGLFDSSCENAPTPSKKYLIWEEKSEPVFAMELVLSLLVSLLAIFALTSLYKGVSKYAHSRH